MINPFIYRLMQGIAKGKLVLETKTRSHFNLHIQYRECDVFIKSGGKCIARAGGVDRRPSHIEIFGRVVPLKPLLKVHRAVEEVKRRKADRIALNKLMSYLSGSSEDSLTNK